MLYSGVVTLPNMSEIEAVNTPIESSGDGPPPLPVNIKESWNGWWTLLWGAVIMMTWFTIQGIVLTAFYMMKGPSKDPVRTMEALQYNGDVLGAVTLISAVIVCPLCWILGHLKTGWNGWEYLGFRKVGILKILFWIGVTFLIGLAFNFVGPYLGVDESPEFTKRVAASSQYPILLILGVSLGAPFIEEFIFRGLLFRGWRDSKMSVWPTIILTSLIWTSLHVQYGIIILTWLFLLGVVIGYARQKTGSIWVPIAMHAFNNALASLQMLTYMK